MYPWPFQTTSSRGVRRTALAKGRDNTDDKKNSSNGKRPQRSNLIPNLKPSRREILSSQIQSLIRQLQELGTVWGDAKTANVSLDKNDNLWIIDFGGGGRAPGWIDKVLIETKEGDLQGLKRILDEIEG